MCVSFIFSYENVFFPGRVFLYAESTEAFCFWCNCGTVGTIYEAIKSNEENAAECFYSSLPCWQIRLVDLPRLEKTVEKETRLQLVLDTSEHK